MLNEIAQRLHFNYSIRIAADAAYGKEDENGQWSGIIGELTRRVNDRLFRWWKNVILCRVESRSRHWRLDHHLSSRASDRFHQALHDLRYWASSLVLEICDHFCVGITILFRKPLRTKPNLFAFLAPLKVEVWLCMAIAYVGKTRRARRASLPFDLLTHL